MKKNISKGTIALLIAAVVLISFGSLRTARAALTFKSEDYKAWFYLNHLQVHLLENGRDVCDGQNDLNGENKVHGNLVQYLGYEDQDNLGSVEPGRVYKEEIAARNGQDIPQYLRLTVRKYWKDTNTGEKATTLSPDLIHLTYGDADYNNSDWVINPMETTSESATYYYRSTLDPNADTAPLFDRLMIDSSLLEMENAAEETDPETGKTTYTYEYRYDGYAFFIEADVQAIQTHNINDAIHSQWGVYNVTAENGTLSVN